MCHILGFKCKALIRNGIWDQVDGDLTGIPFLMVKQENDWEGYITPT